MHLVIISFIWYLVLMVSFPKRNILPIWLYYSKNIAFVNYQLMYLFISSATFFEIIIIRLTYFHAFWISISLVTIHQFHFKICTAYACLRGYKWTGEIGYRIAEKRTKKCHFLSAKKSKIVKWYHRAWNLSIYLRCLERSRIRWQEKLLNN